MSIDDLVFRGARAVLVGGAVGLFICGVAIGFISLIGCHG